jgi:hypothetical protein
MASHRNSTPCILNALRKAWAAAGVLLAAAAAQGQSPLGVPWTQRESVATLYGQDEAVDMQAFQDEDEEETWVFVTGYMTNSYGGKFLTIYRYDYFDPDPSTTKVARYPSNWDTTTREHKAAALVVDDSDPMSAFEINVYVVGETEKSDGTTDYVTLKYNEDLEPVTGWGSSGAVTLNGGGDGDDGAVDVVIHSNSTDRRVVVTGTTWEGSTDQKDITTVCYDVDDGDELWSYTYDAANGDDTAVEMGLFARGITGGGGDIVVVAGTSWGGSGTNFDLVGLAYNACYPDCPSSLPLLHWTTPARYDGPDSGEERCTGITQDPVTQSVGRIVLIGSTPASPAVSGDREYLLYAVTSSDGTPFDAWEDDGYGDGARAWGGVAAVAGEDTAWDAVTLSTGDIAVTGEIDTGSGEYGVGTALFDADDGSRDEDDIFEFSTSSDQRGYRITRTLGDALYVGGALKHNYAESISYAQYLTLRYGSGFTVSGYALHVGSALDGQVQAIWAHAQSDPSSSAILVTGRLAVDGYLWDWHTIRYNP